MRKILIYILFPLLLSACVDEQSDIKAPEYIADVPEGKAKIVFDLCTDDFQKPVVKSIQDVPLGLYVLSFRLENNGGVTDTIFTELANIDRFPGVFFTYLNQSSDPHLLVFVANASNLLKKMIREHNLISKKYGEVMPYFAFGSLSIDSHGHGLEELPNPCGNVPFDRREDDIPSWAKIKVDKIEPGTSILEPVFLKRIACKIYIDAREANKKNDFTLREFTVLGVPSRGYIDNDGAASIHFPENTVDYGSTTVLPDGATTLTPIINTIQHNMTETGQQERPIYVFPFRKDDDRGGVYNVIFGGYFGFDNHNIRYFRLEMKTETSKLTRQNVVYRINILSVNNRGYRTIKEAIDNPPATGIVADITVAESAQDIIANSHYYMGLSNSNYYLCDDGAQKEQVVATLSYGSNGVGTSQLLKSLSWDGEGLSVPTVNWNDNRAVEIKAHFQQHFTEGVITIKIGELSKDIKVKRFVISGKEEEIPLTKMQRFEAFWEKNENNFSINQNNDGTLLLRLPANIPPVGGKLSAPGLSKSKNSFAEVFSASVLNQKSGRAKIFDSSGGGTTVVDIVQPLAKGSLY